MKTTGKAGKTIGKPYETHRKTIGNHRKNSRRPVTSGCNRSPGRKTIGKTMETKTSENHRQTSRENHRKNPQENHRKTIGKRRKTIGKLQENLEEPLGNHMKLIGKQQETIRKPAGDRLHLDVTGRLAGKPWENHGKKTSENQLGKPQENHRQTV